MTVPPIAIVGRACVLPGALDPGTLWERVRAGADLVTSAPAGRWRADRGRVCGPDGTGADRAWTDRGGYVTGFDAVFDPEGFALPPERLRTLDPLVLWLLHVSRAALRVAGVEGGPRVAAVLGNLSFPSASLAGFAERCWIGPARASSAGAGASDPRNRFMSGLPAHLVARALGLGTAFALDAACASSLYAIKLACDLLHDGRADVALAGAVNAADTLFLHVGFTALQALSRSGRSRPFHRGADGLLPAEGAGAVALKRLEDAEAAGDRIFGVILGVGLTNDGRGRGLLAPAEEGQERAMRAAYAAAGLSPDEVTLLECHATGTAVGDAAEVRSTARVFEAAADLPIGSLKSNLGHAVTAAGIAGLLKVLGALEAGERPPTLHADEPLELLRGTPLRLLSAAEPWECAGPRRAAVSAFGFGGTNAHLIVEEHTGRSRSRRHAVPPAAAPADEQTAVAVVGLGAALGSGRSAADFAAALFADGGSQPLAMQRPGGGSGFPARSVELPVTGTRFTPHDLSVALPQQIWTMTAAREALAGVSLPPRERSGAFVGVGCDPLVARYGARWRLPDYAAGWGVTDAAWVRDAAAALASALDGAGVLGTMPNLPANRLNVQFDLAGPGFTVSAEELSGVRALQLAVRALRAGELDLALAGAADFSCEPVHEAAARELALPGPRGDGAVVLALKRLADARRDGDRVLCLVVEVADHNAGQGPATDAADDFGAAAVAARFGRAHAAFGLVRVAAAVSACAAARLPGGASWTGERAVRLEIEALGGQQARVEVRAADEKPAVFEDIPTPAGPLAEFQAHAREPGLPPLPVDPAVMAAAPPLSLPQPQAEGPIPPRSPEETPTQSLPPAPFLAHEDSGAGALPVGAESAARAPEPSTAARTAARAAAPAAAPAARAALAQIAEQVALAARAHRSFLEDQAAAHRAFLDMRERAASELLAAVTSLSGGTAAALPAAMPVPGGEDAGAGVAQRRDPAAGTGASADSGITLDRRALETQAAGKLSDVFGPRFADLDDLSRRVRMPEPPLLLADRAVFLRGEPRSLGTGALRTETDILPGAWYLHEGRIPAGIMVEAGQADLLLVSWLGVDALNRGERVYRLLGCELTWHGGLPVAGDTLRYEISVDGHARQGAVRLFFFGYVCTVDGVPRLTVRSGQAGFFTDEELAGSAGVIWDPHETTPRAGARVDRPAVRSVPPRLSRGQLESFAAGRADACFGPGFEGAAAHTRTPRIAAGRLLLLDEVTQIAAGGGPWGRGYLRAVDRIDPADWFFAGHFTNDPCMPGTLMLEGCLQAMAVYLAALGFTLERDGWRFEPVPDEPYRMLCRGQVTPASRELVYEVFVEEVSGGPRPTLVADVLCTVDGLKAFHCRRMGLRLVPGWPLDTRRELLEACDERVPVASGGGVRFDGRSLLACAWGRPSAAFGEAFRVFDGERRLPRLPGPPYQFMSRVLSTEGEMGALRVGSAVEVEYDVPSDAWYFDANGARTMPYAVLLEAALQPCGWLATWAGGPLATEHDLCFRNLDGSGRLLGEVRPGDGRLRTRAVLTQVSRSAGMLLVSFDVTSRAAGRPVYELTTTFGFFPAEALARQVGLPVPAGEREALAAVCRETVDLRAAPESRQAGAPHLGAPPLLMLDRVTGIWPDGGPAGLGRYRAESDVDPAAWFFKAHFFQDPVQPGSLGLEAMLQLLQFAMLRLGMAGERRSARFEPLAVGEPHSWKYRGQVLPGHRRVTTLLDLVRVGEDERGPLAVADAALWVDGTRIYEARGLAMRVVTDAAPAGPAIGAAAERESGPIPAGADASDPGSEEEVLDPLVDTWLQDHRPTWTVPALPMMSMVDRLARAAARCVPGARVVAVDDARVLRWVPVTGRLRLKTAVAPAGEGAFDATLLAWREADNGALSRFEPVATGRVTVVRDRGDSAPPPAWEPPAGAVPADDPYVAGSLFHGPSFQLLRSLALAPGASSALLDAAAGGAPRGLLHEGLLDALTHGIPHDRLGDWSPQIPADHVAYPHRLVALRLYAPLPDSGQVRCETRFDGFDGGAKFPRFRIQAIAAGRTIAELELVEALFPKGPLGSAPPGERRDFLSGSRFVPGLRLSTERDGATLLPDADVRASDWLPGTLAQAYGADGDLVVQIAAKEHVAARAAVHPVEIELCGKSVANIVQSRGPLSITSGRECGNSESGACSAEHKNPYISGTYNVHDHRQTPAVVTNCQHDDAQATSTVVARFAAEPLTARPLHVERDAAAVVVRDAGTPALDLALVRAWWDGYFRIGSWPTQDVYYGLAERFVRRVRLEDPAGFAALRGRAVLYLANHQVGVESILFSLIASGLSGIVTVTLAKTEHRATWLGDLIRHAFAWPGAHDPGVITYFDRSNREELPRVIGVLAREIASGGKSVMIHVEGTRALTCRAPVVKMSGAFLDMAVATGAPVIPVRFAGGLPVEPAAAKLEYPVGMGSQEILIGAPILPIELAALPYKERKERVIDAINGLGASAATEEPSPPDAGFAAAALGWAARTGASPEHAALFETLRRLEAPGEQVARLLTGARAGRLELPGDPRGLWLAELARRLFGPRGPAVVVGGGRT